jgi:hypothetical protein
MPPGPRSHVTADNSPPSPACTPRASKSAVRPGSGSKAMAPIGQDIGLVPMLTNQHNYFSGTTLPCHPPSTALSSMGDRLCGILLHYMNDSARTFLRGENFIWQADPGNADLVVTDQTSDRFGAQRARARDPAEKQAVFLVLQPGVRAALG